jgi:hypothetical protein
MMVVMMKNYTRLFFLFLVYVMKGTECGDVEKGMDVEKGKDCTVDKVASYLALGLIYLVLLALLGGGGGSGWGGRRAGASSDLDISAGSVPLIGVQSPAPLHGVVADFEVGGQVEASTAWLQVTATRAAVAVIEGNDSLGLALVGEDLVLLHALITLLAIGLEAELLLSGILLGVETGQSDEDKRLVTVALVVLSRPTDAELVTSLLDSHWAVLLVVLVLSFVGLGVRVGQSLIEGVVRISVLAVGASWLGLRVAVLLLEVTVRRVRIKLAERLFANREAASVTFAASILLSPVTRSTLLLGILELPVEAFNPRVRFGFLCKDEERGSEEDDQAGLGESGKDHVCCEEDVKRL